jgi:hypothetical protein
MNLFTFLLRSSWLNVSIATIAGTISGFASAAAIASINYALTHPNSIDRLFLGFLGLSAIAIITQFFSQFVLSALLFIDCDSNSAVGYWLLPCVTSKNWVQIAFWQL